MRLKPAVGQDHWTVARSPKRGGRWHLLPSTARCDHRIGPERAGCFRDEATALNLAWYLNAPRYDPALGVSFRRSKRERKKRAKAKAARKRAAAGGLVETASP